MEDVRYSRDHYWVRIGDQEHTVGLTRFGQQQMGEVTYVDLVDAGEIVAVGALIGVIESIKAATDLHAPIGGVVTLANPRLKTDPHLLSEDPAGEGWLLKIKNAGSDQIGHLLVENDYYALI